MKNKHLFLTFSILTLGIGLYLLSDDNENLDSVDITDKTSQIKTPKTLKPNRVPSSQKTGLKIKKLKLPPKPVALYKSEQRLKDRVVPKEALLVKNKIYGQSLSNGNSKYELLNDYFALKATEENKLRYPNHTEKLGYIIFQAELMPTDALRVTQNSDSGALGIVTGVLKIKLTDFNSYSDLFDSSNYSVTNTYEHINLVHYQFDSVEDALLAKEQAESNQNVQRVKLEILEYARHQR